MRWISLMMIVVLFTGCATMIGPRMSEGVLDNIQDGVSSKGQVVALMGNPIDILREDKTSKEKYIYENETFRRNYPAYCTVGLILLYGYFIPACYKDYSTTEVKRLSVIFDDKGIVQTHVVDNLTYYGFGGYPGYSASIVVNHPAGSSYHNNSNEWFNEQTQRQQQINRDYIQQQNYQMTRQMIQQQNNYRH